MNIKKNYMYLVNIAMFVLILIGDILYMTLNLPKLEHTIVKGITSLLFVILGAINLVYAFKSGETNKKFSIIILAGLFFAMLGDIILNVHFIAGAMLFAVGHIFFFISYCFILSFRRIDFFVGVAIFLPSVLFITLAPIFNFDGVAMEIVCVLYAIIISCMLGKSISNLARQKNESNIVICLGSFLFFFSDLMLLFNVFGGGGKVFDVLCLSTYYPAETLLALSILIMFNFKNFKEKTINTNQQVRCASNGTNVKINNVENEESANKNNSTNKLDKNNETDNTKTETPKNKQLNSAKRNKTITKK